MWHRIGLDNNIFFTHALRIDKQDKELLVGRYAELSEIIREINSVDTGIKIITGKYGTGKTSLLNIAQLEVFHNNTSYKRLLPSYRKIRLDNYTKYNDFMLEVILSLCENIRIYYMKSKESIPDSINFQIDYWLGIKRDLSSSGREIEIDLQLLKMKSNSTLTDMIWNQTDPFYSLRNLLDEFIEKSNVTGVFFNIDNLELVDNDILIQLLDNSRDTLFTLKNTFWLLCSSDDSLPNEIYVKSPRFSSIITGHPLRLKRLESPTVIKAIESRIDIAKIDKDKFIPIPFTEDVIHNVYSFTNYDLRESFRIFHHLATDFFSFDSFSKELLENQNQLDFFTIKDTLVEYCLRYTELIKLTKKEYELLNYVFLNSPCSMESIKNQGFFVSTNLNNRLKKMLKFGLIKFETKSKLALTFRLKTIALSNKLSKKANKIALNEIPLLE